MEAIASEADLVTFSGDKLLGGPQCGIIVGRADLLKRIKRNPLIRATRVNKLTVVVVVAILRLYANRERLPERLPTLQLLTRPKANIEGLARRLAPVMHQRLHDVAIVAKIDSESQIGRGALPVTTLPSAGLALRPVRQARNRRVSLKTLAAAFRNLPVPVIGRIQDDAIAAQARNSRPRGAPSGCVPGWRSSLRATEIDHL